VQAVSQKCLAYGLYLPSRFHRSPVPEALRHKLDPTHGGEAGEGTYTMPSIVSDVSAMLVDTTILRPAGPPLRAGGALSKIFCCMAGGSVEYRGTTSASPTCRDDEPAQDKM
jgi:hypothetical protein